MNVNHDQPDWSEIWRREIGTGPGQGLDLDAATDAADAAASRKR